MTVFKAFYVRRRNGGPSSRLIQTFLREGVFYYLLISIANLVCHTLLMLPVLIQLIARHLLANRLTGSSTYSKTYSPPKLLLIQSARPRQAISAINIPLSVMLSPVLACRLVRPCELFLFDRPN
jgi:hypothetical protein